MKNIIFTICSANYLTKAKITLDSVAKHSSYETVLFLTGSKPPIEKDFGHTIITVDQAVTSADTLNKMGAKYDFTEFNTAVKPFCFQYFFNKNYDRAVYIDPDTLTMSDLDGLLDTLGVTRKALATPHYFAPPPDDGQTPSALDISRSGLLNFGFLGLAKCDEVTLFLDWWQNELAHNCVIDISNGIFVDQSWGQQIICMVPDLEIMRHPGWNVAYWNLHERTLSRKGSKYYVDSQPLVFFHFSGFTPKEQVSKHGNRAKIAPKSAIEKLANYYADLLETHADMDDQEDYFQHFDNGKPITPVHRQAMKMANPTIHATALNEIVYNADVFYKKMPLDLVIAPDNEIRLFVEPIIAATLKMRPDIQRHFSITEDCAEIRSWFMNGGHVEMDISHDDIPETLAAPPKRVKRKQLFLNLLKLMNNRITRRIAYSSEFLTKALRRLRYSHPDVITKTSQVRERINAYNRNFTNLSINTNTLYRYYGYFDYSSGLAQAARLMAEDLAEAGQINEIVKLEKASGNKVTDFKISNTRATSNSPVINIFHCNLDMVEPHFREHKPVGKNILYCVWELPLFDQKWFEYIDLFDAIWVPSVYVQDNLRQQYGILSRVVAHPKRPMVSKKPTKTSKSTKNKAIKTLVAFDTNSFPSRKNPLGALHALIDAAKQMPKTKFEIIVKQQGYFESLDLLLADFEKMSNVKIIHMTEVANPSKWEKTLLSTDIFVSLHRSEGFGLVIQEAIERGAKVITTGYSGNVDFCVHENVKMTNYSLKKVKESEYPVHIGNWWAEPDLEDASNLIIEAVQEIHDERIRFM